MVSQTHNVVLLCYYLIFGYRHLWDLSATIIGLIVLWGFLKLCNCKIVLIIAVVLYLVGSFLGIYIKLISPSMWNYITRILYFIGSLRNGLLFGFPLLFIGCIIRQNSERIFSIKMAKLIIFSSFFICLSFMECFFIISNDSSLILDNAITVPLFATTLFVITARLKQASKELFIHKNSKNFRNLSVFVYKYHIIFLVMVQTSFLENEGNESLICALVLLLSNIVGVIYISIARKHPTLLKIL